jgi:hypothetical protein
MKKPLTSAMFIIAACAAIGGEARAQVVEEPVAPPQGGFAVEKVTATGTGCPDSAGVSAEFTSDGAALVLGFAWGGFVVSVAPGDRDAPLTRTCQVTLDLRIPVGYRVALASASYQGYASLDPGLVGRHMTRYWFLGTRAPARLAEVTGPLWGPYSTTSDFGPEAVASLCNLDRPLYIQTTLAVSNLRNPRGRGLLSVGGSGSVVYELVWSRCAR